MIFIRSTRFATLTLMIAVLGLAGCGSDSPTDPGNAVAGGGGTYPLNGGGY